MIYVVILQPQVLLHVIAFEVYISIMNCAFTKTSRLL